MNVRDERATSAVEFALLAPLMIFMLIGLIEIGRFMYFAILAANAARAGAQYGAQNLMTAADTAGITSAAVADGQNLPNWTATGGGVTATTLCSVSGSAPEQCATTQEGGAPANTIYYVQVRVTGTFNSLLQYPGIPSAVPVSGSSTMRVEIQ